MIEGEIVLRSAILALEPITQEHIEPGKGRPARRSDQDLPASDRRGSEERRRASEHRRVGARRLRYGEPVIGPLTYFMSDREENLWVRRHVPSTLALLPFKASADALVAAMSDGEGFWSCVNLA